MATGDKSGTATFTWDYDNGREKLINLYHKGKKKQWDANERIDWSHDPIPRTHCSCLMSWFPSSVRPPGTS